MSSMKYDDLAEYLIHGREIEFAYQGRQYSITNHSGFWYLCDDTDHVLIKILCRVSENEILVSKVAAAMIDGLSIQQIFDKQIYDREKICVL